MQWSKEKVRGRVGLVVRQDDISRAELAALADQHPSYISSIVNDHKGPSIEVLGVLVDHYGIDGNWLLTGVGPRRRPTTLVRVPGPPGPGKIVTGTNLAGEHLSGEAEDKTAPGAVLEPEPRPNDEPPLTDEEADRLADLHPDAALAAILPTIEALQAQLSQVQAYGTHPELQQRLAGLLREHPEAEGMVRSMLDNIGTLLANKAKNGR